MKSLIDSRFRVVLNIDLESSFIRQSDLRKGNKS